MEPDEVAELLGTAGAIRRAHYVDENVGMHLDMHVDMDQLYRHRSERTLLTAALARAAHAAIDRIDAATRRIETVVSPVPNGGALAHGVAQRLAIVAGRPAPLAVTVERHEGKFQVPDASRYAVDGRYVLVVVDALDDAASLCRFLDHIRLTGGVIAGVAAILNHVAATATDVGDPPFLASLMDITIDAWKTVSCPVCKNDSTLSRVDVGKGRKLILRRTAL